MATMGPLDLRWIKVRGTILAFGTKETKFCCSLLSRRRIVGLKIVLQEILLNATSVWNRRTISASARLQLEEAVNSLDSGWNATQSINAFLRHSQQQTLSVIPLLFEPSSLKVFSLLLSLLHFPSRLHLSFQLGCSVFVHNPVGGQSPTNILELHTSISR
jgi:hypothetical protein